MKFKQHTLPERPRAFITGAAGGLGRALALQLAHRRGRLALCDVHAERLAESVEAVRAVGGEAEAHLLDVTDAAAVERIAELAWARWGGLDLVVNNAGVACAGPVGEVPLTDWRWAIDVNLWGVIHGCHVFAPRLRAQGHGAVLNVASAAGIACAPEMGPYNVGKAGVIALSETLHGELRAAGVGVTVLCPTFFPTHLLETMRATSPRQHKLAQRFFDRSKVTADDVARAALVAVEAGELYSVPQSDAKAIWALKRLAPGGFHTVMALQQRFNLATKFLRPGRARKSS